ncbi:MAG TPA: glycosyltransferase family 4 protein, partial [Candidatus Limnocylindrales bacterium]|nr:glycosyltransferase family 4 protein [Candidatus Limnocylindrales bacterium]
MIVHSYYDEDPRVRREAETLARAGDEVDVIALRRPVDADAATVDGVRVQRLGVQRHQGAGIATYLREYVSFLVRSGWALARAHRHRRYDLVQVHSLPDFLVFAALPLRVLGVPVVLDLHEAMPEFFRSRFPRARGRVVHGVVRWQERLSIAFANRVITVNDALRDRLLEIGVPPGKVEVVANAPDLTRFDPAAHPARPFAEDGIVRLIYAGALTPIYELDVVLDAIAELRGADPARAIELEVYGRGDAEPGLAERARTLGIDGAVRFHGRIPIESVPAAIAAADIGVAPTRRDEFTDASLSTKIFEYAAMGKPVVASALPLVDRTFPAGTVATYEPGDPHDLARAIGTVIEDAGGRARAVDATRRVVAERSWAAEA